MRELTNIKDIENFSLSLENKWCKERLQKEIEQFKTLLHFWSGASFVITVTEEENDIVSEFYSEMYLQLKPFKIIIRFDDFTKKWNVFASLNHLKNLGKNDATNIYRRAEAPNKIGVLTTNKLQNWVYYETAVYSALKTINDENFNTIQTFIKSLEGENVRWWGKGKDNGEIRKGGLRFVFEIYPNRVYKKIEIDTGVNITLEDFNKLADNKFNK